MSLTGHDLLKLLQDPKVDLDKLITVSPGCGWWPVEHGMVAGGSILLELAEESH